MKSIKNLREQYDIVTESDENETRKLTALVRAGLFDAKKLPALKRALDKNADKMTSAEKRMLINLLDSLMSEVITSQPVYNKVKQNVQHHEKMNEENKTIHGQGYLSKYDSRGEKGYPKQEKMPAVIILKRKAIRVYPDNTKVALYYSQALDKYVSIPFGETGVADIHEAYSGLGRVGDDVAVDLPGQKGNKKNKKNKPASQAEIDRFNKEYNKAPVRGQYRTLRNAGLDRGAAAAGAGTSYLMNKTKLGRLARLKIHNFIKKTKATKVNPASQSSSSGPSTRPSPSAKPSNKTQTSPSFSPSSPRNRNSKMTFKEEKFRENLKLIREYSKKDAAYDAADIATDLIPGVSNVKSAYNAVQDVRSGNYGSAALNAALAVPGVGNVGKAIGAGLKAFRVGKKIAKGASKVAKVSKFVDTAGDTAKKTAKVIRPKEGNILSKTEKLPSNLKDITPSTSKTITKSKPGKIDIETPPNNLPAKVEPKPSSLPAKVEPKTSGLPAKVKTKASKSRVKGRLGGGLKRLGAGAAAGAIASKLFSGGNNDNSSKDNESKFVRGNYNFNLKPEKASGSRFDPYSATHQRDAQANRKFMNNTVNEDNFKVIKDIVENNLTEAVLIFGDREITINNNVANKINNLYESMNKQNKKKMKEMLNESAATFNKVLTFTVRY